MAKAKPEMKYRAQMERKVDRLRNDVESLKVKCLEFGAPASVAKDCDAIVRSLNRIDAKLR